MSKLRIIAVALLADPRTLEVNLDLETNTLTGRQQSTDFHIEAGEKFRVFTPNGRFKLDTEAEVLEHLGLNAPPKPTDTKAAYIEFFQQFKPKQEDAEGNQEGEVSGADGE